MAARIHLLSPNTLSRPIKSQLNPFSAPIQFANILRKTQISCANKKKNRISDADLLTSHLATELAKINTQLMQKEEAMNKSKELLFTELCQFLGCADKEEVKRKWSKMDGDEKWVLVKRFVTEWSVNFHPLSSRSVKEMIEEYVQQGKKPSSDSALFLGLKRMLGLSSETKGKGV